MATVQQEWRSAKIKKFSTKIVVTYKIKADQPN